MEFKSHKINRRLNELWFFELFYVDTMQYKITINGEGFLSKEDAERNMKQAKKTFEEDYRIKEK